MDVYCAKNLERETKYSLSLFMSVQMESKHKHGYDDTPVEI